MKSTGADATLGVGEVAARFGVATHVLRHWESVGLLSPERVTGRRRRYGPRDVFRVAAVLRAKEAGLGLESIRGLLTAEEPEERTALLEGHLAALREQVAALQASLHLVECALNCPHDDLLTCPNFLAAVAAPHPSAATGPLPDA